MSFEFAYFVQFEVPEEIEKIEPAKNGFSVSRDKVIRMVAESEINDPLARHFMRKIARKSRTPLGDVLVSYCTIRAKYRDPYGLDPTNAVLPNSEHVVRFLASPAWCERGDRKTHFVRYAVLWEAYSRYAVANDLPQLGRNRFYNIIKSAPVRGALDIGPGAETGTGCAVFRGVKLTEM